MTKESFLGTLEAYYGQKYPTVQAHFISLYLADRIPRALDMLLSETLKSFSSQYGKLPDIAVFESLRKQVNDDLEADYAKADLTLPAIEGERERDLTDAEREQVSAALAKLGLTFGGTA